MRKGGGGSGTGRSRLEARRAKGERQEERGEHGQITGQDSREDLNAPLPLASRAA